MESTGLIKRKRVTLLLGGGQDDEELEIGVEGLSDGSENQMDVDENPSDTIHHRPRRKRRRIVSAATVLDEAEQMLVDDEKVYEGWETYESETTCAHCHAVGIVCRTFVLRSHGPPRFACCRCHDLKRMCEFTKPRRLAYTKARRGGKMAAPMDDEDDADGEADAIFLGNIKSQERKKKRQKKRQPSRAESKSATGNHFGSGSNDEDEDAAEIQRRRKASGKGKGKQRQRSEMKEISVKREEDDGEEWLEGKYFLLVPLLGANLFS